MGNDKKISSRVSKKNTAIIIASIIILATIAAISIKSLSGEDGWICQNGGWVKHGNPSLARPVGKCGQTVAKNNSSSSDNNQNLAPAPTDGNNNPDAPSDIQIEKLQDNDTVSSPLEIDGQAKGGWFFEGQFPVKLIGKNGEVIAETQAKALGDWTKEDAVPFRAILEFPTPAAVSATLVLAADDPSGQGNGQEKKIPVTLGHPAGMRVKVFLGNIQFDPDASDCGKVYEVERVVPKSQTVARSALGELLSGPTDLERSGGYSTNINSDVTVQNLSITGGVAKVDFSPNMEDGVSGDCRIAAIKAQITQTLEQFPTVKEVEISVDGKTDGVLAQ